MYEDYKAKGFISAEFKKEDVIELYTHHNWTVYLQRKLVSRHHKLIWREWKVLICQS